MQDFDLKIFSVGKKYDSERREVNKLQPKLGEMSPRNSKKFVFNHSFLAFFAEPSHCRPKFSLEGIPLFGEIVPI